MTDTVAVALIAVSGTLGSGFLSYLAARRGTEVQLGSINAEMQRLQETHAEEHRRERQAAYLTLIANMDQVRQLAHGLLGEVTVARFRDFNAQLGDAYTNVLFLGEDIVIEPLEEMAVVFGELIEMIEKGGESTPFAKRLEDSFIQLIDSWNTGEERLIGAMKTDIKNAHRVRE